MPVETAGTRAGVSRADWTSPNALSRYICRNSGFQSVEPQAFTAKYLVDVKSDGGTLSLTHRHSSVFVIVESGCNGIPR
jgi:hypothetical protein